MPVKLQLVQTIEEIRDSLHAFNRDALHNPAVTISLLTQTTYWAYDPDTQTFGPSKFIGLGGMNIQDYEYARRGKRLGAPFDGGQTRLKIEKLLGEEFVPNPKLAAALEAWAHSIIPTDAAGEVFDGVDKSKWLFVSLPAGSKPAGGWGPDEIAATVEDYFSMLQAELSGEPYSKAAHRARLVKRLNHRSGPAVEFKHCNISAVLEELGLPFISGYKPRHNYQTALADAIDEYLAAHSGLLAAIETGPATRQSDQPAPGVQIEDLLEEPPAIEARSRSIEHRGALAIIDWAARDEANRKLGASGEQFVAELERRHLISIGKPDLANRVEVIAQTQGDGAGYDVHSFTDDGQDKLIEVKTTNGSKRRPFPLSANELCQSGKLKGYWLYRVFRNSGERRLFRVPGSLEDCLDLTPTHYRAMFKGGTESSPSRKSYASVRPGEIQGSRQVKTR